MIHGIDAAESTGAKVFHAGTKQAQQGLTTSGGRVLGVTASGRDLRSAILRVYDAVSHVRFDGMHYRKDIGAKGLRRSNES
jgi:phosphoribosylamine--glycine ligase